MFTRKKFFDAPGVFYLWKRIRETFAFKARSFTTGHLAAIDSNGNYYDSGKSPEDIAGNNKVTMTPSLGSAPSGGEGYEYPILVKTNANSEEETNFVRFRRLLMGSIYLGASVQLTTGKIVCPGYYLRNTSTGARESGNKILLGNGGSIDAPSTANTYLKYNGSSLEWASAGGASYSAGDGISIRSNTISVTTAQATVLGTPEIGGLLVTYNTGCDMGFCNCDDVVAVPIFYGSVENMSVYQNKQSSKLANYDCHYVNVRSILEAIIDDNNQMLAILKDALEKLK